MGVEKVPCRRLLGISPKIQRVLLDVVGIDEC